MHNRSIFICLALVLAVAASGSGQGSEGRGQKAEGRRQKAEVGGQQAEAGDKLIAESAHNLLALPGLEAEFRYQVQAYDQSLTGSGRYVQAGDGPEKLFRMELTTQLEDYKASQQTISGKQYLWIRRDLGP